eukprot:1136639-Pelagomonas_calceolata.AAC.3
MQGASSAQKRERKITKAEETLPLPIMEKETQHRDSDSVGQSRIFHHIGKEQKWLMGVWRVIRSTQIQSLAVIVISCFQWRA